MTNMATSWICRETKQVFINTNQASRHAGVSHKQMRRVLDEGMKFYRSKANGHTYFVHAD